MKADDVNHLSIFHRTLGKYVVRHQKKKKSWKSSVLIATIMGEWGYVVFERENPL